MKNYFFQIVTFFYFLSGTVLCQTLPLPGSADYDQLKIEGKLPPSIPSPVFTGKYPSNFTIESRPVSGSRERLAGPQLQATTASTDICSVEKDASFKHVVFYRDGIMNDTLLGNDDASSLALPLGFTFNFYGEAKTSVFINNNGNISFDSPYITYNAVGFPSSTYKMIAGFWGDVDTRPGESSGNGSVYYKVTPTSLIVIWEKVGYFNTRITNEFAQPQTNTFKIVLTNGSDPLLGNGNNVALVYGNMQWTSSSYMNPPIPTPYGFTNSPDPAVSNATVGMNKGDGTSFFQYRRFNKAGTLDNGLGSNANGIDILSNKCIKFNTNVTGNNTPPIAFGFPPGDYCLSVGESPTLNIGFDSPENTQSTTITTNAATIPGFQVLSNTPGASATMSLKFTGGSNNIGPNTITFTATDNGSPAQTTTKTLVVRVNKSTTQLLTANYPSAFSSFERMDTTYLRWRVNTVPPLGAGTQTQYKTYVQVIPAIVDATTGQLKPDIANKIQYNVPPSSTLSVGNYSKFLDDLIDQTDKDKAYFWRVGLEYLLTDPQGVQPVFWTDYQSFTVLAAPKAIPASYLAANDITSATHTNKINWVYQVDYLDNNTTNQSITYMDGLGKQRQTQALVASQSKVLATETAYSEESDAVLQSMTAPTGTTTFGYAVRQFDAKSSTGVLSDYTTETFDRDIKGSTFNTPMTPFRTDTTAGVGNYYRGASAFETHVDNAKGFPFAYTVNHKDPLNRPALIGGLGETFRINGGRETQSFTSSVTFEEMARVFGRPKAGLLKNLSKTITIDPNGTSSVTYTDNEGKTIATALAGTGSANLDPLVEDGKTAFTLKTNILQNDNLTVGQADKNASSNFSITAASTIKLYYSFNLGVYATGTNICRNCDYDVRIKVIEDATGLVMTDKFKRLPASGDTTVKACNITATTFVLDTNINLPRAGTYTVTRSLIPHVFTNGKNAIEEMTFKSTSTLNTASQTRRNQFAAEYYNRDEWYVLRQRLISSPSAACPGPEILPKAQISFATSVPQKLVLQPNGSEIADARIDTGGYYNANTVYAENLNNKNPLYLGGTSWSYGHLNYDFINTSRHLIDFNLKSIPSNATIIDAKLNLYSKPTFDIGQFPASYSNEVIISRVTSAWNEATVTWNTKPTITSVNAVTIPRLPVSGNSQVYQNTSVDITPLIKDVVANPSTSFGLHFKLQNEFFYTSMQYGGPSHPDPTSRPKLEITYVLNPPVAGCANLSTLSNYATVAVVASPGPDTTASAINLGTTTWNKGMTNATFATAIAQAVNSNTGSHGFTATSSVTGASPDMSRAILNVTGKATTGKAYNNWKLTTTVTPTSGIDAGCFSLKVFGDSEIKSQTLTTQYNFLVSPGTAPFTFSPAAANPGATVTLTGTGFTGTTAVMFNNVPAKFTIVSATSITVPVPYNGLTGPITIVNSAGTRISSTSYFTVNGQLQAISASPVSGPPATAVTLTGTNFLFATDVIYDKKSIPFKIVSNTSIETVVPPGAVSSSFTVKINGLPVTNVFKGGFSNGTCEQYAWYLDKVTVTDTAIGKKISDLDARGIKGAAANGKVFSESIYTTVGAATQANQTKLRARFIELNDKLDWVTIKDADIVSVNEYPLTGGTTTLGALIEKTPVMFKDNTKLHPFTLIKVKFKTPTCEEQCVAKEFPLDCKSTCNEKLSYLTEEYTAANNAIDLHTGNYQAPDMSTRNLAYLRDNYYPWSMDLQTTTDDINPKGLDLYLAYDVSRTNFLNFNLATCEADCSNPFKGNALCETCGSEFQGCVFETKSQLNNGYRFLMEKWDKNIELGQGFPFTEPNLRQLIPGTTQYQVVTNIYDSLGKVLYDYVLANVNNPGDRTAWEAKGAASCVNCATPANNSFTCTAQATADLSYFPNILAPLLNAAVVPCSTAYVACLEKSSDFDLYTCKQNRQGCIANAITTADTLSCNTTYNCAVSTRRTTDPQRRSLILETLNKLYIRTDTIEAKSEQLFYHTLDIPLAELPIWLSNYETAQRCKLQCANYFETAFTRWIENKKDSAINYVYNNFVNTCYNSNRNEILRVEVAQVLYHYTLYNYNPSGGLDSTVSADGIDYVDIFNATPSNANRVPTHRMPSIYHSNSLGQLLNSRSPDAGTTNYLYDIAGRVRFSQNAEQLARGNTATKDIFSYTIYEEETGRVKETGEYTHPTKAGFSTYISSVNTVNWPSANTSQRNIYTYDLPTLTLAGYVQKNLHQRISKVSNGSVNTYYSYDKHGRVTFLVQELLDIQQTAHRMKTIEYRYSHVTSQVQQVIYQKGKTNEDFRHRYTYDTDNRLSLVEVSRDTINWAKAAAYAYYLHGPLKSKKLGDDIQKLDYVHNLQGWLKSINHPLQANDPGQDGIGASTVARDVFGEVLNYYSGDYKRRGKGLDSLFMTTPQSNSIIKAQGKDLFNSNITGQVSYTNYSTSSISPVPPTMMAQGYRYDQLNRLLGSKSEQKADAGFTSWTATTGSIDSTYLERLTYDANGNIQTLRRTADKPSTSVIGLDKLTYNYSTSNDFYGVAKKSSNRLNFIGDTEGGVHTGYNDIADQTHATNKFNYKYDAKGRMRRDSLNNIDTIKWTAYDKVREVVRRSGKPKLRFTYDAFGRRVSKTTLVSTTDSTQNFTTYYVYDGSGNVMAAYQKSFSSQSAYNYTLTDEYIYGLERIGDYRNNNVVYNGGTQSLVLNKAGMDLEVNDHLGNVRAVVRGTKNGTAAYSQNLADYYPFGMMMKTRQTNPVNTRYGYNGKEIDNDGLGGGGSTYDYGFRIYNPKIAKFLSTDPLEKEYPWNSPYAFAENRPIDGIDLDGKEWENFKTNFKDPGELKVKLPNAETAQRQIYSVTIQDPNRSFEDFKKDFKDAPQNYLSNSKAEFEAPVDDEGEPSQFKVGSNIKINIKGPLNNSYVRVKALEESKDGKLSATFVTLEGHVEKGIIDFTISQDENGNTKFEINSQSEVDFGMVKDSYARSEQMASWKEVLNNVVKKNDGKEVNRQVKVIEPKTSKK